MSAALAPAAAASAASLRYVTDVAPGVRRRRSGKGFRYEDATGQAVRDPAVLARIRSLAIPPAWRDVWICPSAEGHLQATGRDSRGRKQYRYHPRWREVRDLAKYERMLGFARALPLIRSRTDADLARPGLTREKVLAAVVRLLETTLIRVGNEEYARHNGSFGLTTMRDSHVEVNGSKLEFRFRGKSGREHVVGIQDRRLARIVKRCRELPGYELFQYLDEDGARRSVESTDVNDYLRAVAGDDYTAKDFRTWAGTVLAAFSLRELGHASSRTEANRHVVRAIQSVAQRLGNTPAVCRKCYVHPEIVASYLEGSLIPALQVRAVASPTGLAGDEAAVLRLLERRLAGSKKAMAARPRAVVGL